jgi:ABC-type glycerol-3-phosphate transport system permease component
MTFWRHLPLMLPGITASLLLTFIISFDEFLVAFSPAPGHPADIHLGPVALSRAPAVVLALGAIILTVGGAGGAGGICPQSGVKKPMVGA